MLGKKKKQDPPGDPITDEPKEKRWLLILALGSHGEDAIKLAKDGTASTTETIEVKDDGRILDSKQTVDLISSITSDLLDSMEKFVLDEANKGVGLALDIHVCGPMNACTLLGIMAEKIRHQMFNDFDVMVKIGCISCYDRVASKKIEIVYQEI